MLNVSEVRQIACNALRDQVEQSISEAASSGRENVIIGAKKIPVWLEAELTGRGFILSRHVQTNCPDVVEVFWGTIKE